MMDVTNADSSSSGTIEKGSYLSGLERNGVGIVHCNNINSSDFYYNLAYGLERLENRFLLGPDGPALLEAVWAMEEGRLDDVKTLLNSDIVLANATSRGGSNDYRDLLLLQHERLAL